MTGNPGKLCERRDPPRESGGDLGARQSFGAVPASGPGGIADSNVII